MYNINDNQEEGEDDSQDEGEDDSEYEDDEESLSEPQRLIDTGLLLI